MSNLIALIPARGGSKGLPNKNVLKLFGSPLINWSIKFALAQSSIDRCIVSTDSEIIAKIAQECGAEVPFLRYEILSSDDANTSDVILDVIDRCDLHENDRILLLEPTSPYRTQSSFLKILELFDKSECQKVVSVSEAVSTSYMFQYNIDFSKYPKLHSVFDGANRNGLRRQDVDKSYYLDGSFYISYIHAFLRSPGFLDSNTIAILNDYFSSFEIDSHNDLRLMEAIFSKLGPPF